MMTEDNLISSKHHVCSVPLFRPALEQALWCSSWLHGWKGVARPSLCGSLCLTRLGTPPLQKIDKPELNHLHKFLKPHEKC